MMSIDLVKYEKNIKKKEFFNLLEKIIELKKDKTINKLRYKNKLSLLIEEYHNTVNKQLLFIIINSEMYKELCDEYYKYLEKIITFFVTEEILDGLGVALLYQELLDQGYLSYNKTHRYNNYMAKEEYKKYKLKYEIPHLGCRVATGKSLCRHMTDLLVSIENIINNKAVYTNCFRDNKDIDYNLIYNKCNHALAIIIDNNNCFAYCPTSGEIFNIFSTQKSINGKIYKYLYLHNIDNESVNNYIVPINSNIDFINDIHTNFIYNRITKEKIQKRTTQIIIKILEEERKGILNKFYNELKPNSEIINKKINEISPAKREKIKKLIIR